MHDNVSTNNINSSTCNDNNSTSVPTNILSSSMNTSSSLTSPATNLIFKQSTTINTQALLPSPIKILSSDPCTTMTTLTYSSILQPIVVDESNISPLLDPSSYSDLQPCSLNMSCEPSRSLELTVSSNQQNTSNYDEKHLFTTGIDWNLSSSHISCST
ncbi:unnamed protein product [Rotaria socialis]